jgi:hypothetical protein
MQTQLTPRQIAGAANGRLAAGAKSPEGRARSSANATKHGLTAQITKKKNNKPSAKAAVILLNESPAAFDQLFHSLCACFQPTDAHEFTLLRRMAESEWLRQRALLMESAAISEAMRQQALAFHENSGAAALDPINQEGLRSWHAVSKLSSANPAFAQLQRYAATHARAYTRAERDLRDYRISKAESIHPIPESLAPATSLQPTGDAPQPTSETIERWQPLEVTTSPDPLPMEENTAEDLLLSTESTLTESTLTESPITESPLTEAQATEITIPETTFDETKVTLKLQSNLLIPGTPPQAQQPIADADPGQDRVG